MLNFLKIEQFKTHNSSVYDSIPLSYETFGCPMGTAPIVLVNHALTGNSSVVGEQGWWKDLIGEGKCIDTNEYSILAFNIPGNGYDGFLIDNYENFSVFDIARLFLKGLELLDIDSIFAVIGGSLGGNVTWQMAVLRPELMNHIIPIASDWKATDWILAQCRIQKQLLENSSNPLQDARMHAMTFYRTPQSLTAKFDRSKREGSSNYDVENWLKSHGEKLEKRFHLKAYKLMNHLLMTADVTDGTRNFIDSAKRIKGAIHLIGIDSDHFYLNEEIINSYLALSEFKNNISFSEINSIHGHDGFLIEFEQLSKILKHIFQLEHTT
ncbi:alpha/beta fold hydrolase [Ulvibacter antarcticus]|uniref:Homoserine O-acetyltransferase n=1 Tax=Ulvibacter antarcticus TaxID=442714 RepID=A0A3L9YH53_9FLAO|nr:alpha/beta fold hydrolase [Ulvibacter antarcticus]RMA57218.1 homoserine O-acetyltransferase [Ulvibacter antarcticus]